MAAAADSDRMLGLRKAFDDTKAGVKGLVDAGVTSIPPFFVHSQSSLEAFPKLHPGSSADMMIVPVIDLKDIHNIPSRRLEVIRQVKDAASGVGFFQVVNHGIEEEVMQEMLRGVKGFHEDDTELKRNYYSRDEKKKVRFFGNFDLFKSPAANWKDTLLFLMSPEPPAPEEMPPTCREIAFKYTKLVLELGSVLFELLSEALGLDRHYLKSLGCTKSLRINGQYYPPCPEPHRTLGSTRHSDPGFLTVLLQDGVGGLQIFHADHWIDVPPLPGALVVNIANLLQLVSNDGFVSVEHRVVSKSIGPRVSVAGFFVGEPTRIYGPIEELTSETSPPLYREVTGEEFGKYYGSKGLAGRTALNNFRL